MGKKIEYPLNSLYGVSSMSHSSYVRTDTNLKTLRLWLNLSLFVMVFIC